MRIDFKVVLVSIAISLVLVYAACFFLYSNEDGISRRDYGAIEKEGVLRVVTRYSTKGYYVSGDSIEGYNQELLNLLKKSFPFKVEIYLESDLEKSITGLNNGSYDLIASHIVENTELKEELAFTDVKIKSKQLLVQRKKIDSIAWEPVRSMLQLAGETIHVSHNSPVLLRLKNLSEEIGDTIFAIEDSLYSAEQLAMKVHSGEINFAVCNEHIAGDLKEKLPNLDFNTHIGFTHFESWAVRKTSPNLRDSINSWVKKIEETPEFKEIYSKYSLNR